MATASSVATRKYKLPSAWRCCMLTTSREGNGGRALAIGGAVTGDMTVAKCVSACKLAGYSLSGVEYAGECCKFYITLAPYP